MDGPLSVASFVLPPNSNDNRKRSYQDMSLPTHYPSYLQPRRRPSTPCSDESTSSSLYESSSSCQSSSTSSNSTLATISNNVRLPAFQARRGLDMRRPAPVIERPASVPQARDVIDLTEDAQSPRPQIHRPPSPPRVRRRQTPAHEVIDLGDSEDDTPLQPQPSSPEIQFIRSRPRSRSASNQQATGHDQIRDRNRAWLRDQLQNVQNGLFRVREQLPQLDFPMPNMFSFGPPDMLDFGTVGFDLDHPHRQPPAQPRLPTYTAPPPPREGFTRSNVQPDSLMVCPMCDDELGVGESEQKKQVWVAKLCGHVYCGECASNRSTSNKKRKSPTGSSQRPFRSCVVDNCGNKKISGKKDMLQVFL